MPLVFQCQLECDRCGSVEPLGTYTDPRREYLVDEATLRGWQITEVRVVCPHCLRRKQGEEKS
jgi:hypothetical protein